VHVRERRLHDGSLRVGHLQRAAERDLHECDGASLLRAERDLQRWVLQLRADGFHLPLWLRQWCLQLGPMPRRDLRNAAGCVLPRREYAAELRGHRGLRRGDVQLRTHGHRLRFWLCGRRLRRGPLRLGRLRVPAGQCVHRRYAPPSVQHDR
jgi:hypothetical protein